MAGCMFGEREKKGISRWNGRINEEEKSRFEKEADCERTAFKEVSKAYPNYGKKTDMGARQWWTEVCDCSTFLSEFLLYHTSFLSKDPSSLNDMCINLYPRSSPKHSHLTTQVLYRLTSPQH
jgi:hypothetical protein